MNLKGKNVLVTGIASNRSISYAIAKILHKNGANVIVSYQNDRLKERVIKLKNQLSIATDAYQCDLSDDNEIETLKNSIINNHGNLDGIIHSAAFAPKEQLSGKYIDNITRDGFAMAHDISSYSLTALSKAFKDSLNTSSSIVTLSYIGAERVVQNYNIMGVAKASLECSVKYLADSLGEENITSGLWSFIFAFILVLFYMIFYYKRAGWVANVALIANVFFIIGTLASLGAALTLPGIAGLVLTIGMSVDANVLIYERIR